MDIDFVAGNQVVASLGPIVGTGVRKESALCAKGCGSDLSCQISKSLESLFVVLVPKIDDSVGSGSRKGPELLVKGNGIDGKDVVLLTMALEGEGILAVGFGNVMNSHASFDTPHGKAGTIVETGHASRLVPKRRFLAMNFAGLTRDIVGENVSSGSGYHEQIVADVHGVDTFGHVDHSGRIGTAAVPEFQFAVPSATDNHASGFEVADRFDGGIVCANLLREIVGNLLAQLPHANSLVATSGKDRVAFGIEARIENGHIVFVVD